MADYIESRYGRVLSGPVVSVHVRRGDRGDALDGPDARPVLDAAYYERAVRHFGKGFRFLVFGDDPEWCRRHFTGPDTTVVSGEPDYVDLFLMSRCRHHIIANSTFSWWGAWLNPRDDKVVVAPERWFGPAKSHYSTRDLLPQSWVRLPG